MTLTVPPPSDDPCEVGQAGFRSAASGRKMLLEPMPPGTAHKRPRPIVIHPCRVHLTGLTLGVMALAHDTTPNPSSSAEQGQAARDLALNPLRVPLQVGRLAIMQTDPARAHVLYVELDLRPPDGRRLREICGAWCVFF